MVWDAITGVMLFVELQRGKEPMRKKRYWDESGATAACTLRLTEGSQHLGQNLPNRKEAAQLCKSQIYKEDSWFCGVEAV